jgi:hypothetical protein
VESDAAFAPTPEDRLFFDYLRGDFAAAEADLDALDPTVAVDQHRLALLSLRAQVLLSKGETIRAQAVADYLIRAEGGPVERFEETPLGPVLTREPGQTWARYLSSRANGHEPVITPGPPDLPNPFAPFEPPEFQRERGGAVPFAPFDPGGDLNPIPHRPAVPGDRPPGPPRPVDSQRRRRADPQGPEATRKSAPSRKESG